MKIIFSNYRYFISGGPEKYMFAIQEILRSHDHEVMSFSVRSSRNLPCDNQERFLSPISDDKSAYFHEYKWTPISIIKVLARQFYCPEAFFKARSFSRFTGADIVYSLQFLNKMSPALLDGFKSAGLPVVLRISDFGLICPQAHLFDGSSVCEKCIGGNYFHAINNRCVFGSRAASFIKGLALYFYRILRCRDRIDAFVFPSRFTMERFAEAGFPEEKLYHVPTFIDSSSVTPCFDQGDSILYFGRLVVEKGIHHLLEAYRNLPADRPRLVVIGAIGKTPYADALMKEYKNEVLFYEFMNKELLASFVRKALCVVIPSIWYDNLPNVLLEAYAYGKPVIAPRHGCFLDLVNDGLTGLFFEPGNSADLGEKLTWATANPEKMAEMGRKARTLVETDFSPETHYVKLMTIFNSVLKGR